MADEQTPVVTETPVEPLEGGQPIETTPPEENPNLLKFVADGEEKVFDITNPEALKELTTLAQAGVGYTKKMQGFSEIDRQMQELNGVLQMITSDPDMMKIVVAKMNGANPAALYGNYTPPPEAWLNSGDANLVAAYWQNKYAYDTWQAEKDRIEKMSDAFAKQSAQKNNSLLIERAKIKHSLNDGDLAQVQNFLTTRMRPNAVGIYSDQDMEYAVSAVLGSGRERTAKLNTVKQIDENLKKAKSSPQVSVKSRPVNPADADREKFHQTVKEVLDKSKRRL